MACIDSSKRASVQENDEHLCASGTLVRLRKASHEQLPETIFGHTVQTIMQGCGVDKWLR